MSNEEIQEAMEVKKRAERLKAFTRDNKPQKDVPQERIVDDPMNAILAYRVELVRAAIGLIEVSMKNPPADPVRLMNPCGQAVNSAALFLKSEFDIARKGNEDEPKEATGAEETQYIVNPHYGPIHE